MALEAEEPVGQGIISLLLQQRDRQKLALGLAHLAMRGIQVVDMEPLLAPGMAQVALRLGDLVGVMGEGVVDAAAVEIQILAVVLQGNTGALDVPAGIAHTPGRVPLQCLILKLGLGEPEDEVVLAALVGVLFHALPDAHGQILLVVVVEDVVVVQLAGVEVHVTAGKIGVASVHQPGDDLDILVDAASGGLDRIGGFDVQFGAVLEEGVGIELGDLHDGLVLPLGALEHLILTGVRVGAEMAHIRDVHDPVDTVSGIAQEFLQHILHDIAAQVADMGEVVHRGAAGIHFHVAGGMGLKFLFPMGRRIVQIHLRQSSLSFLSLV